MERGRAHTSWITIGNNELTWLANKLISVPDSLIEQRWQTDWEAFGAITSHNLAWVCNVALLIRRGWVDSIPAAREHELKTNSVDTIGIKISLVRKEVAIEGAFRGLAVIKAVETNGSLFEESLGVVWSHIPE
jgi:hypothetical protein